MSIETHEDLHRRNVLCGGGAFVFAAMIASLLEVRSRRARKRSPAAFPKWTAFLFASSLTAISSPSRQVRRWALSMSSILAGA